MAKLNQQWFEPLTKIASEEIYEKGLNSSHIKWFELSVKLSCIATLTVCSGFISMSHKMALILSFTDDSNHY